MASLDVQAGLEVCFAYNHICHSQSYSTLLFFLAELLLTNRTWLWVLPEQRYSGSPTMQGPTVRDKEGLPSEWVGTAKGSNVASGFCPLGSECGG